MKDYLDAMLDSFAEDPPDTDYQRGYLAALLDVRYALCVSRQDYHRASKEQSNGE